LFQKEVNFQYACDGCGAQASGEKILPEWQFLVMQPAGQNEVVRKALLCPKCVRALTKSVKFVEVEARTNRPI
jgi:hypothetical protein